MSSTVTGWVDFIPPDPFEHAIQIIETERNPLHDSGLVDLVGAVAVQNVILDAGTAEAKASSDCEEGDQPCDYNATIVLAA